MRRPKTPSTLASLEGQKGKSSWRRLMQTTALFLFSCVLTIALGELAVRLFIPVRNLGPTFSEYDPYYGKILKRNFRCERIAPEFSMIFSTNSYGFRGPEPDHFPNHCVLFLGDSFTSGYGVNDGEEFPDLVRKGLLRDGQANQRIPPVVNAGLGNTGNSYWLRFLKAEGERYEPRFVVFAFCENDFADNTREQFYFLDSSGTLRDNPAPATQEGARVFQRIVEAIPGLTYSHLVGLAREFFSEGMMTSAKAATANTDSLSLPGDALTYKIVSDVFQFCRLHGWPAMFLTIGVEGPRLERLREISSNAGIPFLVAPLKKDRPDLYYHIDGHWNAAGHRFVSAMVLDALERYLPIEKRKEHQ